jgi:hypothetical protein
LGKRTHYSADILTKSHVRMGAGGEALDKDSRKVVVPSGTNLLCGDRTLDHELLEGALNVLRDAALCTLLAMSDTAQSVAESWSHDLTAIARAELAACLRKIR